MSKRSGLITARSAIIYNSFSAVIFKVLLNLFRIAFAAGAFNLTASTADLNMVESAVAARVIILALRNVASYSVINVFHKYPPKVFCAVFLYLFRNIDKIHYPL